MAFTDSSVLDDQISPDGDSTFVGGQVSATPANLLGSGSFAEAVNMDFDNFGRLITRRGARTTTGNVDNTVWEESVGNWDDDTTVWASSLAATPVDACFYFDTNASEYVVIAQDGGLLQGTESSVYAAISGATYSGDDVYFAQLNNRLYYADGVGALRYVDSSVGNNTITAGKVSSIKILNEGSGYTSVPAITLSGAATATAVLGYGGRVIAATVTSASSGYSLTAQPSISIAAPPAGGVQATARVNLSQVPSKPKLLTSHTNRLFAASADTAIPPDTIYVSDILDGEAWDLVGSSIRVGGDGDPITGLYSWFGNNLLVFKQRSIWVVEADPLLEVGAWVIRLVTNRIGCVAHRSIQSVGADIYFLARDGVRALSQIQSGTQTDVGTPLSVSVQDEIDAINQTYLGKACSAFHRNRYFLAITQGSSTTADCVLVYNTLTKSWCGSWTGWSPTDFAITAFNGKIRLNFSDNTGRFWTWDDFTSQSAETASQYRDDSNTYESYVVTRAYSHGDPLVDKQGHIVQFLTENKLTDGAVTAYAYYDQDMSGTFTALDASMVLTAGDRIERKTFNLLPKGKYNVIQFKFGATMNRVALNAIAVTGFSDTLKTEL